MVLSNFFEIILPNYLTAVGTISATIVALFLGLRKLKPKLNVCLNAVTYGGQHGSAKLVIVEITNQSHCPCFIESIGFRFLKSNLIIFLQEEPRVSPKILQYGEKIRPSCSQEKIFKMLIPALLESSKEIKRLTDKEAIEEIKRNIKLEVQTTTDCKFKINLGYDFFSALVAEIK